MSSRSNNTWIPQPGTVLDDRYRLGKMIDRGGMGVVLRGEHIRMKRDVAVKLLSPDIAKVAGYRARFRREVDVASGIEHPHLVRCYDYGETSDGLLYLVMELLEGQTLERTLEKGGRFDLQRATQLTLQLLDGLAAAHLRDVVHRDLKPGNAFLSVDLRGREVLKLLDFGLAKSLSSTDVRITQTGAICGTASYLAPEALVVQEVSKPGDVYAVGLLMLEMVIGRQVFSSRSMAQTFIQQLMLPPLVPKRVAETPYGELLMNALLKHPDDRPQSAEEMYQWLLARADDIPDIKLTNDEIPPPAPDALPDDLLVDLANGRARDLAALKLMPAPAVWEANKARDEHATQRMSVDEVQARIAAHFDQMTTETVEVLDRDELDEQIEAARRMTLEEEPKTRRVRPPRADRGSEPPAAPAPQARGAHRTPANGLKVAIAVSAVVLVALIIIIAFLSMRSPSVEEKHPTQLPAHMLRPPEPAGH